MLENLDVFDENNTSDVFIDLVMGLQSYLEDDPIIKIPVNLRRALNALSLAMSGRFPKTLSQLLMLCAQPTSSWYPLTIAGGFDARQPILYDQHLSEEAQDYCLEISEHLPVTASSRADMPRTVLQNFVMVELRRRLKDMPDNQKAQELYASVRSFLIEHSWTTQDVMRNQDRAVFQELRAFYEEIPAWPVDSLKVCDRCGLLEWNDGHWRGVKPGFCSEHGSGSSLVREIKNSPMVLRLKRGNHLRTFLPGKLELALFRLAERMQSQYPEQLPVVERYPGLDTYDLRLAFADDDAWAIDGKDHAQSKQLARHIRPLYREGALAHTAAFYVLPDARLDDVNYRETLTYAAGSLPPDLDVVSVSTFQHKLEQKLKYLAPSRRYRQRKG